jgi:hypothetical protein
MSDKTLAPSGAVKAKPPAKKARGHNLAGRPKGAKNKTTIFKEVMQDGFENALRTKFPKVVQVVLDQAMKGDLKAAKMLFDRVIPVGKAVDLDQLGKSGISISINVGEMDSDNPHGITIDGNATVVEDK